MRVAKCWFLPWLVLLLACSPVWAQEGNPNVRFGMPSAAKADPSQREDYLIARPQYVLSYNAEKSSMVRPPERAGVGVPGQPCLSELASRDQRLDRRDVLAHGAVPPA